MDNSETKQETPVEVLNSETARYFQRRALVFAAAFFSVAVIFGMIYTWGTTQHDVSKLWYLLFPYAFLGILYAVFGMPEKELKGFAWFMALLKTSTMLMLASVILAMGVLGFVDIYLKLQSGSLPRLAAVSLIVLLTISIGILLFILRLRRRFIYGLSEVCVGLIVAGQRFYDESANKHSLSVSLALTILTAGVYLVVRGADNVHQGLRDEKDPAAQKFLRRINRSKNALNAVR